MGLLASAGVWEAVEARLDGAGDGSMWLALSEDSRTELGRAEEGPGADMWWHFSWRTVRSVLVGRENVFKVEPRWGVEQLRNALKHL